MRTSQVPGEPQCMHAQLFDPGGTSAPGQLWCSGVAFRRLKNVGSRKAVTSGLNHKAYTLAVYASPRRSPDATQDSLPVGGQPLPSGTDHPPGSSSPFSRQAPLDDSKRPGFPGARRPDPPSSQAGMRQARTIAGTTQTTGPAQQRRHPSNSAANSRGFRSAVTPAPP